VTLKQLHTLIKKEFDLTDFILIDAEEAVRDGRYKGKIKAPKTILILCKECKGSKIRSRDAANNLNKRFKDKGLYFRSMQAEDIYPLKK
jgi:hypothetical protein